MLRGARVSARAFFWRDGPKRPGTGGRHHHVSEVAAAPGSVWRGDPGNACHGRLDRPCVWRRAPYAPRPTFGGWYFPSPQGKRYDPDNFSSDLARVNKAKGIVWACLDYRHTFGSQLAMKGESLYKISALLGNSPDICRTHYAALVPTEMASTVDFPAPPTRTFHQNSNSA